MVGVGLAANQMATILLVYQCGSGEIKIPDGTYTVPQDALCEFGGGLTDGYLVVMDIMAENHLSHANERAKEEPREHNALLARKCPGIPLMVSRIAMRNHHA